MLGPAARRRIAENKLAILRERKRIDVLAGGTLTHLYEASCVLALLETMAKRGAAKPFFAMLRDEKTGNALQSFPVSWRHPLLAAGVLFLRLMRRVTL